MPNRDRRMVVAGPDSLTTPGNLHHRPIPFRAWGSSGSPFWLARVFRKARPGPFPPSQQTRGFSGQTRGFAARAHRKRPPTPRHLPRGDRQQTVNS
jgi:hypothetical protein